MVPFFRLHGGHINYPHLLLPFPLDPLLLIIFVSSATVIHNTNIFWNVHCRLSTMKLLCRRQRRHRNERFFFTKWKIYFMHFILTSPEVGNLRPRGHSWPDELFIPACRAFTIISPKAKIKKGFSLIG